MDKIRMKKEYLLMLELEVLLGRVAKFPGTLNQQELRRAEELLAVAQKRDGQGKANQCAICGDPRLDIDEPIVCHFHAKGLLHRDPDGEW